VGEYTGLIADHLELAGRSEEAVEYLLEGGDKARGLYAHQEAIDAYERALVLLKEQGDDEQAARTLMKLGLTYHTAFQFRRSREAYEDGFALWQRAARDAPAVALSPAPHALRTHSTDPRTLDPTMAIHPHSIVVIDRLFSGLAVQTPEMEPVPDVARTWEVLEGGRKYAFHLRDDVRWSDGAPVVAGDFEYAWKRMLDPAIRSPNAELLYDVQGAEAYHRGEVTDPATVGVRALNEVTLVVELEEPTAYFLQLLAHNATYAIPRHVVDAHGKAWTRVGNIATNGPFRLEAWERAQSLVLVRSPQYHGRFRGNVQRVELSLVKDRSARLQMYEADALDVLLLWGLPPPERDRARQRHAGEFVSILGLTTTFLKFDVSRPPFDDPRVRRAFVLATDRETLAGVALGGYDFPATGGFIPPGMPGHSPGIGLPYDPNQAQQLLAEAGYPGGRGFPAVDARTRRGHEPEVEFAQAQWRGNLGVEITWEIMDWAIYRDRLRRGPPQVSALTWMADYPDPDNFLRSGPIRRKTWQNEAYERLVEEARRVQDQGERMKLYQAADTILVEEAPIVPLYYDQSGYLVKPWVRKFRKSALGWEFWKDVVIEPH
jgi:oligopeptide transport system substrate-binding protein